MMKKELAASIAEKTGLTKKDSEAALNAVVEAITEALAKGESVQLTGFGTFAVKERAARTGLNPQTKATIEIPAAKVPGFKAGKALKDAIAK